MAIIDQNHGYHDGRPMIMPCVLREAFPDQCFVGACLDGQHIDAAWPYPLFVHPQPTDLAKILLCSRVNTTWQHSTPHRGNIYFHLLFPRSPRN
eukprot:11173976-Lingulodinium_polyedra.AAC.1